MEHLNAILKEQLRHLSDTVLYAEAQKFLKEHQPPDHSQLNGLLAFSRNAKELTGYVTRQRERNWGEGYKGHYSAFYGALDKTLRNMKDFLLQINSAVDQKISKADTRAAQDILSREFIHHVVAHALFAARKS